VRHRAAQADVACCQSHYKTLTRKQPPD
jgi:hypothetical protein